ncbi:type IV secretory system conjugative DNA transfer family protein [Ruminococcus sp. 1001136sp1]|uniref:VirD4-like conjugal transfer protein, CD1115 family n=1 Tax=Ruminococcus sp. 1001136sp1 TaxID=2986996 RepID=UPI003219AA21
MLTEKLDQPFSITYTPYTLRCVFTFTIAYVSGIGIYYSQKKNYRRGVEHGSAKWGDAASICKRYRDKRYTQNLILTQNFRMGLDCYKHKRNLNVLVVGGSGAGKSRAYAVVNIMQCNCSMVITDPKGELLRKTGGLLEREGYEVRVFDLINPETSFCYNPFAYVRDDKDVLKLINNLIRNTTPKGAQSSDPFWEKSETALLQALMLYLLHEAPPEEQNFSMIMEMLGSAQVKEDDEEYQSPLDILFERLEMRNPESIAVKQYAIYKQAAGKTAKSILISCGARLAPFDIPQLREIMSYDELELDKLGDEKSALFFLISDTDTTYNFLVALAFSQMFNLLCERADNTYGGRLPYHVRVLWDEAANTGQVPGLEKIVAVIRSREISLTLFYQAMSQCKALYKDHSETIMGNMDSIVFLGGREASTLKDISENWLGKATISMQTEGRSRGQSESYSQNMQRLGRELMTTSEITTMPGDKCILQLRGLPPFLSPKYDLKKHPNYKYTAEFDKKKNAFRLESLFRHRPLRLKPEDEYTVYEVDGSDTDEEADLLNFDDLDSDEFV